MGEDSQKILTIVGGVLVGLGLLGGFALINRLTQDSDDEGSKAKDKKMVSEKEQESKVFNKKDFINILNNAVIGQSKAKEEIGKNHTQKFTKTADVRG